MAKKINKTLGRGFESLIPTNFSLNDVVAPGEQIKQLSLDMLVANPDQPRKHFDEQGLRELATSIKQHGIIQPLVATPYKDSYRIVAGERRFRASQLAGLKKIPVIIRNHAELEELEIALVENVQRVDLSPLEQALSIVRLRDQFSLSTKDIAQKLGKAETTISNIVRLLQLPPEAIEALQSNIITEGHARTLLSLKPDVEAQLKLLNTIVTQKLSVREAEKIVQNKKGIKRNDPHVTDAKTKTILSSISQPLNRIVKVKEKSAGKGTLLVSYTSHDELKKFLQSLDNK